MNNETFRKKTILLLFTRQYLSFKKNVCIGRYFNQFQRDSISKKKCKQIDIWPLNFMSYNEEIPDQAWKFMLQLACILQMVPLWKNSTKLRVFSARKYENPDEIQQIWERRLKLLRIECEIHIADWSADSYGSNEIDMSHSDSSAKLQYFTNVNRFIRWHSQEASLVFLYLPAPPVNKHETGDYLQHLTQMTENFPPTIFIHGVQDVTSISL